jgi:hypothetical protein
MIQNAELTASQQTQYIMLIALVEGIVCLTKSDKEFEQLYTVQRKQWF